MKYFLFIGIYTYEVFFIHRYIPMRYFFFIGIYLHITTFFNISENLLDDECFDKVKSYRWLSIQNKEFSSAFKAKQKND